ncbi:MAG: (5-formylfuran-3-yl)methyl phosphate synthase, partial [Candidatus Saccharimonadales bacterium]
CGASGDWPSRWADLVRRLPASCAPVAVIYADWQAANAPTPKTVLAHAATIGCRALLIDTFSKKAGALFDHLQPSRLEELVTCARLHGLVTVLAGSLTLSTARDALKLHPDYLAVRGAVCDGSRVARLMPAKVRRWKAIVEQSLVAS